jgi:hypothetical protein
MRICLVAVLAAACSFPAAADAAGRSVPRGFVGVVGEGPLLGAGVDLGSELNEMVGAGVERVRISFPWIHAQPYATMEDVPLEKRGGFIDVGGVPTDWSFTDRIVRETAARGLGVLPVVLEAPGWAALYPGTFGSPPADVDAYARFVAALAVRYGPNGSFWVENPTVPKTPIRDWQIWNEPNIKDFWTKQPSYQAYTQLLRATRSKLKRADPSARIVLAGLVNRSWDYLTPLYKAGARRYFDVAAIHPFTAKLNGVITIIRRNRKVMRRYNDARKPLLLTEISWTSTGPDGIAEDQFIGIEVTERQQAARVKAAYNELAKQRKQYRLEGVFWFSWLTQDRGNWTFFYAGLRKTSSEGVVAKPSFRSFRSTALELEGCVAKQLTATSCLTQAPPPAPPAPTPAPTPRPVVPASPTGAVPAGRPPSVFDPLSPARSSGR